MRKAETSERSRMNDTTYIPETALLAAKRGLAWLELAMPEAAETLDGERLIMKEATLCVVGRTCGDFRWLMRWLSLQNDAWSWAIEHGFYRPPSGEHTFNDLDRAWRRVLADRGAA